MIRRYVKKPIPIEAIQWLGSNQGDIKAFLGDIARFETHFYPTDEPGATYTCSYTELYIHTLEGDMHANIGDYIIRGVQGEFYPCAREIFEKTYDEVE